MCNEFIFQQHHYWKVSSAHGFIFPFDSKCALQLKCNIPKKNHYIWVINSSCLHFSSLLDEGRIMSDLMWLHSNSIHSLEEILQQFWLKEYTKSVTHWWTRSLEIFAAFDLFLSGEQHLKVLSCGKSIWCFHVDYFGPISKFNDVMALHSSCSLFNGMFHTIGIIHALNLVCIWMSFCL